MKHVSDRERRRLSGLVGWDTAQTAAVTWPMQAESIDGQTDGSAGGMRPDAIALRHSHGGLRLAELRLLPLVIGSVSHATQTASGASLAHSTTDTRPGVVSAHLQDVQTGRGWQHGVVRLPLCEPVLLGGLQNEASPHRVVQRLQARALGISKSPHQSTKERERQ